MKNKNGMPKGNSQAQRHIAQMQNPKQWPLWPFLPLIRRRPDVQKELGILYDASGKYDTKGLQTTVFLVCLYDLGWTITTHAQLLAQQQIGYTSHEAIYHDGWEVD